MMKWYSVSQKIVPELETTHSLYRPESTFKKKIDRIFKDDYFIASLGTFRNVPCYFILQVVLYNIMNVTSWK